MPAAPPTKYTPSRIKKIDKYLKTWQDNGDVIPTVEGLSTFIDISRETIYTWAKQKDKKKVSDTLEQIRKQQKQILLNSGLKGEFNSNITKLILHQHGLSDKVDTTVSGDEANPVKIKIEVVNADS